MMGRDRRTGRKTHGEGLRSKTPSRTFPLLEEGHTLGFLRPPVDRLQRPSGLGCIFGVEPSVPGPLEVDLWLGTGWGRSEDGQTTVVSSRAGRDLKRVASGYGR